MRPSYFLLSVSTRQNLELCIKFAHSGFMNNISGVWTFHEIKEGDYVSFLYGARAYNLYKVEQKVAIKNSETCPPWQPITFQQSKKTYYFPFRLFLKPIREFNEPLVRAEFAYVAENLLLRGGYRRTHFQADQTMLQSVSQMGTLWKNRVSILDLTDFQKFVPSFSKNREIVNIPEVLPFHEYILQALVKDYLRDFRHLQELLQATGVTGISPERLEILGEKALPQGHVDILLKEANPAGTSYKIILEIKVGPAITRDISQLHNYTIEIGAECITSWLVAKDIRSNVQKLALDKRISIIKYSIPELNSNALTYGELLNDFKMELS
ncbi:MAG: hypothetical protein A2Z29_05820 [Chloroflexi bacterium RBG_16_56_11]|nr:MAG: hypothetical protein A2Z29_05820 [Chloroflexi bacterium RBG_16_56_11]